MAICPSCRGEKVLRGVGCPGLKPVELACFDCHQTGEVSDERLAWRRAGEELRAFRDKHVLSLHRAARWLGVEPLAWSEAELGRCDPAPVVAALRRRK